MEDTRGGRTTQSLDSSRIRRYREKTMTMDNILDGPAQRHHILRNMTPVYDPDETTFRVCEFRPTLGIACGIEREGLSTRHACRVLTAEQQRELWRFDFRWSEVLDMMDAHPELSEVAEMLKMALKKGRKER